MRFVVGCVREWSKYCQWCCSPVLSIVWNYDLYRAFWGAVMSLPPPFIKNFHLRPRKHNLAALSFCQTLIQILWWILGLCRDSGKIAASPDSIHTRHHQSPLLPPDFIHLTVSRLKKSESIKIRNPQRITCPPLFPLPHISCSLNFPWRDAIAEIG